MSPKSNPQVTPANPFAFSTTADQAFSVMQPLALLAYEAILPGSQLVNRLRELGYRVLTVTQPRDLPVLARRESPMVILLDLVSTTTNTAGSVAALRADSTTAHIPIIAFAPLKEKALQDAARQEGANLIAISDGIFEQLPALLNQVLEVR